MKISLDSFLAVIKRSGLVDAEKLPALVDEFQSNGEASANAGENGADEARGFAAFLIEKQLLTAWQADKLLQGKHKGFVLGKYRLLALLGKGGMSSVYLAEHVLMRRRCAIKVLPHKRVNDASYLGRFHREAQAVASLDHPNIVRAYDVDHETDKDMEIHFLVMEYVEGKSLQELIAERGPVSEVVAADFIRQAALGLEHAHQSGLVHRDIKPGNLLVDKQGTVRLLDLGLARFFEGDEESLTVQHDEKVLGTADYLAPEQAVDSHKVDARADIYSLGCTCYFLLTGSPPFTEGTLTQRLMAHQTKPPPPLSKHREDISPELDEIVQRMMAKSQDDRYQTAGEVAGVLENWLSEHGGHEWLQRRRLRRTGDSDIDLVDRRSSADKTSAREKGGRDSGVSTAVAAKTAEVGTQPGSEPELGDFLASLGEPSPQDSDVKPRGGSSVVRKARSTPPPQPGPARSGSPKGGSSAARGAAANRKPGSSKRLRAAGGAATAVAEADPATTPTPVPSGEAAVTDSSIVRGSSVRRGSSILKQSPRTAVQPKVWYISGAAAGLLLVAVVVAFSGGDDADGAKADPQSEAAGGSTETVVNTTATKPVVTKPLGAEITVGADGDFETINAALDYVIKNNSSEGRTIKVAGGAAYPERIHIENSPFGDSLPKNVHLVCEDDEPAVLNPPGDDPVVRLDDVEQFTFEGFAIEAGGRDTAIELSGFMSGTKLIDLDVKDFKRRGVKSSGAQGVNSGNRIEYRRLTFRSVGSSGVGLEFDTGFQTESKYTLVDGCRFIGPMRAGIEFRGIAWDFRIAGCIFHNTGIGVLFSGDGSDLSDIEFVNNTFHELKHGIVFNELPQGAPDLLFAKNLFANLSGPEVFIQNGYTADGRDRLLKDPVTSTRFNWSERAADSSAGSVDIFASDGVQGSQDLSFASTQVSNANFLKPKGPQLRDAVTEQGGRPYIGAVAPGG